VRDPIDDVALGGVDGDRTEEFVVPEGGEGREGIVSVWRWNGWGFSLVWRSALGR
jgi:hypothetical protein